MSRGPRSAVRERRRRTATGVAVVAVVTGLLPLTTGPASPAHAARPAATPAPAGCGLQLLTRGGSASRSELLVSAPSRLAGVDLLAPAFSLRQADQAVPFTVRRPAASEQAVAVVLASSSGTTPAQYEAAQAAATELLAGLPPEVRTAVGSTGSASPLAPLAVDRGRATRAVALAQAGARVGVVETVDRVARDLPAGAHVVLLSDDGSRRPSRPVRTLASRLHERGTTLTRVGYAGPSSPEVASAWSTSPSQRACAAATADASLERQLEQVQALLRSQYRLSASLSAASPAALSVTAAGTTSNVQLPPVTAAPALADPYRRTGTSGWLTLPLLVIAAELAVLGLLVGGRPRRRQRR